MKKIYCKIICHLLLACPVFSQNIVQVQYFFDSDNGFSSPVIVNTTPSPDGSFAFNFNTASLSAGQHFVYMRTKDNLGKWSHTTRRSFEKQAVYTKRNISSGEYFFDNDRGFGNEQAVVINPQDSSIVLQNIYPVLTNLSPGYHRFFIRFKDNEGNWAHTLSRSVDVIKHSDPLIAGAEYFFDTDPGIGHAGRITFGTAAAGGDFSFRIPLEDIPVTARTLYIRARDSSNNNWSHTQWQADSVVTSTGIDSLWSHPATWSNNRVPDANTIVILPHTVYVDIPDATCKSLALYLNNAKCIVMINMNIIITGH